MSHRPAVLFVDNGLHPELFNQFAAAIHRVRLRTIALSPLPFRRGVPGLIFDRVIDTSALGMVGIADQLRHEFVADVHVDEYVAAETYSALGQLPPGSRSDLWTGRQQLVDKRRASDVIRHAGLRAPEVLGVADATPARAVAELGLPIMVKAGVGRGGDGVRMAGTRLELEQLVSSLDDPQGWFFERFVDGEAFACGALATPRGVDPLVVYRATRRVSPFGPNSEIEVHEDRALEDAARPVIEALGVQGIVNVDIVRDADGVCWFHDVNTRAFGSLMALECVGFPFVSNYARWLAGKEPEGRRRAVSLSGRRIQVVHFPVERDWRTGHRVTSVRAVVQRWRRYLSVMGFRYTLRHTLRTLSEWRPRRGRRSSPPGHGSGEPALSDGEPARNRTRRPPMDVRSG